MTEIRLVLADDHAVVRAGLKLLLEGHDDLSVVAEAGDIGAARRKVLGYKPDVLVLDLNMPGAPTLPAVPDLATSTAVVVLTMQNDASFAREAMRAGACGYVLKEAADAEFVEAVRAAGAGRTYLNPSLGAQIAATPPEQPPADDLTANGLGVLQLIALGHTNTEIAEQLFLSVRTVESHRAHIQRKKGRSTRAELVHYALARGLVGH